MQTGTPAAAARRIPGIDLCRLLAIGGVIAIHVSALQTYSGDSTFDQWLAVLGRAAVPYFFTVSGFLTGLRSDRGAGDKIKSIATRILPVWIFWEAAYLVYDSAIKASHGIPIATDLSIARILIQGGPAFHLWFLPSLLVVSAFIILLKNLLAWRYVLIFAFSCYCALIYTRYSGLVPFDDRDVVVDAAVRSLEGVFFFGIGYWISSTRQVMSTRAAFAILLVGLVGHVAEVLLIHRVSLVPIRNVEITSSMALLAIGLLFVTLTPVAVSIPERMLRFSQYTLGIYAVHVIFVRFIVKRISLTNHVAEVTVQILCSVVLSFLAVYILSLWPRFRTFIK